MARSFNSFIPVINVLLLLLAVSFSFFISEARPRNVAGAHGSINKGFELVFDGVYIEGIKSGPSHGGIGNKYTNAQTLGAAINSDPSNCSLFSAIYLFRLQYIFIYLIYRL
ncbi:hypothetical protein IMY05_014G0013600 [Salix suchowensis]|nr:hypothetical protein IMY05_014G0013600 [Salix suchowensis]